MEFATLHINTYKAVKLLMNKGYTKKEAEVFVEAIKEIASSGVATKQELGVLKKRMTQTIKFQIIQTIAIIGVMIALFQFVEL